MTTIRKVGEEDLDQIINVMRDVSEEAQKESRGKYWKKSLKASFYVVKSIKK